MGVSYLGQISSFHAEYRASHQSEITFTHTLFLRLYMRRGKREGVTLGTGRVGSVREQTDQYPVGGNPRVEARYPFEIPYK